MNTFSRTVPQARLLLLVTKSQGDNKQFHTLTAQSSFSTLPSKQPVADADSKFVNFIVVLPRLPRHLGVFSPVAVMYESPSQTPNGKLKIDLFMFSDICVHLYLMYLI